MNSTDLSDADRALLAEIRSHVERTDRGLPSFYLTEPEKRRAARLVRAGLLTAEAALEDSRCRAYRIA